jgi:hypothetical protein
MGALNLRLKTDITPTTPFGGDRWNDDSRRLMEDLRTTTGADTVSRWLADADLGTTQVELRPLKVAKTLDEIVTDQLDFLHHEAFYVVSLEFDVMAYRTHWFGLEHDSQQVTDCRSVGHGALRTVRWYEGEPVNDGYVQGEFRALKSIAGALIDDGVFTLDEAHEFMEEKLVAWTNDDQHVIIESAF